MNQIRLSGESALSVQAAPANTIADDQRSSLLSILSKVKKDGARGGASQGLTPEDRESIASYLRGQAAGNKHATQQVKGIAEELGADITNLQPSLQMFESLISLVSGQVDMQSSTTSKF